MTNLPPGYIDEWIQGEDRKLLEIYYEAELSESGRSDEVILRGIKAVLAHPSQMVEIQYQGRLFRMWPGGKIVVGDGDVLLKPSHPHAHALPMPQEEVE